MSNIKHIIEVCPPECILRTENRVFTGFVCPSCSGRGTHIEYGPRKTNIIECSRCAGTGKLKAKASIVWEADV